MNKTCGNVIVINAKYEWNLYLFLQNFLTSKDSPWQPYTSTKAHDTKYYGRGKVQILRKKNINIECGITHWNWLRFAFRMTKARTLPGALPPDPRQIQVGPTYLTGEYESLNAPWIFNDLHMPHLCFDLFKIHNKVRQAIGKFKKYDLGSRFWSLYQPRDQLARPTSTYTWSVGSRNLDSQNRGQIDFNVSLSGDFCFPFFFGSSNLPTHPHQSIQC